MRNAVFALVNTMVLEDKIFVMSEDEMDDEEDDFDEEDDEDFDDEETED